MCGIAGLFDVSTRLVDRSGGPQAVLSRMLKTLFHRGPDTGGVWSDPHGRCHLGHRRLSIIDTSDAGRQPMTGGRERWVATFNGEIYNFLELRPRLESEGVRFAGRTDTEVLIESIAKHGINALSELDGQFAFAAFDTISGELFLARDAFGEKPLYYMELPSGGIAFASELQALETVPFFDGEVDVSAIADVLLFQYIGAPGTIYRHVKKLPPGHWLRARVGQAPEVKRYFQFSPGGGGFDERTLPDLADEAEEILLRSLRRRMIADVPLGAFLSGGVDSSTVCSLIRRRLQIPLKTFSFGFRGSEESEHETARVFSAHLETEHYDEILEPSASEFLKKIGAVQDEPNADSSCLPTYLLSQFARRHVTVAISGDGGDELFCGYQRYFATFEEALTSASHWSPGSAYYSSRILISETSDVENFLGFLPSATASRLARLRQEIDASSAPLECRLRQSDVDNYMPGAVLAKVDRMSMRHSLEVRTPFLNVELARFAERLPPRLLYRNGVGKIILKEIGSRYLPVHLMNAPKRGFGLPMSGWGRDALLSTLEQMLGDSESRLAQMIGRERAAAFVAEQRYGGRFSAYQTWAVCTVESWLRHHPAIVPTLEAMNGAPRSGNRLRPGSRHVFPPKPARVADRPFWYARQLTTYYKSYGASETLSLIKSRLPALPSRVLRLSKRIAKKLQWNVLALALKAVRLLTFLKRLALATSFNLARVRLEAYYLRHGTWFVDTVRDSIGQKACTHESCGISPGDPLLLFTYALQPGGAERQWCYLAAGLKREGFLVTMAVVDEPQGSNGHYLPFLRAEGIDVVVLSSRLDVLERAGGGPKSAPFGEHLPALIALLERLRPKAILAQLDYTNLLGASAALIANVPKVLLSFRNYHPWNFSYLQHRWYLPLYRAVCESPRVLLTGNSELGNEDYARWLGIDNECIKCIPNAVDADTWILPSATEREQLRAGLGLPPDVPVILGVFRLSEEKRPFDFLEASRRILQRKPEARVFIVGEGPMLNAMENWVLESGLLGSIRLLGRRQDVMQLMSIASVVLHSAGFEGMPNVIMEAQVIGRPVVATRAGATAEVVIHGKTGYITDIGDVENLAEHALRLIDDKALSESLGQAARAHICTRFSIERLVEDHLALLRSTRTVHGSKSDSVPVRSFGREVA